MKVLITGATGFIGSWMTRHLVQKGLDVRVLCRPTSDLSELENIKFERATGDITDKETVEKAVNGVDSVFHFAGLVAYTTTQRPLMEKVNVEGTRYVIDACLKYKTRRLVNISSIMAIGASTDGKTPLNEASEFNLGNYDLGYAETKRSAELLVSNAVQTRGLNAVILNPATVYGPGDARKGTRSTQIKVARGEFPFYTSGGVNVVDIKSVISAIEKAWEKAPSGERYILSGDNILIKDLFYTIADIAGVRPPQIFLPKPVVLAIGFVGDQLEKMGRAGPINSENARVSTLFHWFDSSKARKDLGLNPLPAKESITSSIHWMKEQGLLRK